MCTYREVAEKAITFLFKMATFISFEDITFNFVIRMY